ncbi:MAG: glycosyltransferase [bacterium]
MTVGTQLQFDRLVQAVDEWAERSGRTDVVAQIGHGRYRPRHMSYWETLDPAEFQRLFREADYIVAHAGIGTILSALDLVKPIVVMPRKAALGEQRNDHQLATAERFAEMGLVTVAEDEHELPTILDNLDSLQASTSEPRDETKRLREYLSLAVGAVLDSPGFDGIVCFGGEDWWYHNRGHYDMQMMREASRFFPVLYVNSIGVRSPAAGEGRVFFQRILRKARSFTRGLKRIRRMFSVYSPVTSPKLRRASWGRQITAMQVRRAIRRVGMKNPLIWVAVPTAAELLPLIPHERVVYQRTDQFEEFDPSNRDVIRKLDHGLKSKSEVTLFCSHYLIAREAEHCRSAAFIDHGVDFGRFYSAGVTPKVPADLASIPRPRVGFVGGIDAHTFDPALYCEVAASIPEASFVLVGGTSLPPDWCTLPNVYMLGRKPYESVPDYMASCDVLIMPWNESDWIQACNPVKLKEYLAVGRPVVSTYFPEIDYYKDRVGVATSAGEFADLVRAAIEGAGAGAPADDMARHTWQIKFGNVLRLLAGRHGA